MSSSHPEEEEYEQELQWSLWRRILAYTLRERGQVLCFCLCGGVVAIVDILLPVLTGSLIDRIAEGQNPNLALYGAAYGGLGLCLTGGVWSFIQLGGRVRTRVAHDIRQDAFSNLQDLSFSFYDHRPIGWLMARMTSDCERLSNIMAWGLLDLVWGFTLMGGSAAVLFFLNAKLALITLWIIPVLAWVSLRFQRRILTASRQVRRTNSRLTASYNEGITGVRTTKVFVREEENLGEFSELAGEMQLASVRSQLLSALYLPIVMAMASLATGLALAYGGYSVLGGGITLGTLSVFLTLGAHFFQPIQELAHRFAELQMAQASAERVLGLISEVPEIRDSPEVLAALEREALAGSVGADPARAAAERGDRASDGRADRIGRIEFRGVHFAYRPYRGTEFRDSTAAREPSLGQPVLTDFNLVLESGETVALVGTTGGGKSTIVNLLCRFYEPTRGAILIDGVDYRERSLKWLQSKLGIVAQEPHLFSGTVRENIRYGRLDATDAEVEEAVRLAGAERVLDQLEAGYDTDVGEDGSRLSVGQKQLLSLARAILAQPEILIMDEATSSVDTETERRVQEGVRRVLNGRTSLVIAHRLSTIRSADRILVIDGGRIVEQGSHAALLEKRGAYYDLYTQQSLRDSSRQLEGWRG